MDVNTAFLHADIHEEIYLKLSEGCSVTEGMKCTRHKKALYDLKQSPRKCSHFSTGGQLMREKSTRMNSLWECTTGERITGEKLA